MTDVASVVHPDHTALVVVDVQNDFMHPDGVVARVLGQDLSHVRGALGTINQAIESARRYDIPVIYVQEVIAKETVLPNFLALFGPWERCAVRAGTWGAELLDDLVQPREDDVVIQKPCYDAFQDTALDLHLRSAGIRTCIYCGGATNVCVEASARHGFVAGYYTVMLEDGCGAASLDEHDATMKTFRRRYGHVLSLDELVDAWSSAIRTP
jgi:ureidoacrylate peracid hydrolase